jgi:hypothetical protein
VVNAGTISGSRDVLQFAAGFANRLIVDFGAVFTDDVNGGGGVQKLASAASPGTLPGFGTRITNFSTLQFGAGVAWTVGVLCIRPARPSALDRRLRGLSAAAFARFDKGAEVMLHLVGATQYPGSHLDCCAAQHAADGQKTGAPGGMDAPARSCGGPWARTTAGIA